MEHSFEKQDGIHSRQSTILCAACIRENDAAAIYCRFCNRALDLSDDFDAVQKLSMEGAVYAKAVEVKPNIVILVGVWLLFFPALIVCLPMAISMMFEGGGGSESFVMFWLLISVAAFSGTMIYKVTRNYFNGGKSV